ncbi:MAG: DUF938 domain-containing protein [Deltaproteobacteria bacterium]|nr:DUF938 domain-containing protein [Deltaproteobacteria bacterium]
MKARSTPAIENNREPIASVLVRWLPERGRVLEIASGPGAHAAYFAERFPGLQWQPSDPAPPALESIRAWVAHCDGGNLLDPLAIDVTEDWPAEGPYDAVLNINMLHVSPYPAAARGLFAGATAVLEPGSPLLVYGPFFRAQIETAPSNLRFDDMLRARDPDWGLRHLDELSGLAQAAGMSLREVVDMPANNNVVVFVKD